MLQCLDDVEAFTQLTDNVYYEILYKDDPKLRKAKEIIQRIEDRDLYVCVGNDIVRQVCTYM